MSFHSGVLKYLAEQNLLEDISRISTVSGGSLLVGLVLRANEFEWPTSKQFLAHVLPNIRETMCETNIQLESLYQLLKPNNWRFIFTRSNLLASAIKQKWQINERLSDLPDYPEWSINGTTAETGKRFRFKKIYLSGKRRCVRAVPSLRGVCCSSLVFWG